MTLEACLNESLSEKYELKTKIIDNYNCIPVEEPMKTVDQLDIIVGTICVIILLMNSIGSLDDIYVEMRSDGRGINYLIIT